MKLTRIELQGFKSFVDRTSLDISNGITAILGPNGCGKSNIVDAVRWVLGEQSPKTLRGDCMEDVIFKGSTKRKPVGLAEVSLIFDNTDRRLPIEFDEVAIRRKVTRDGGSDYFLNGSLCRLKDLRDLFYDSGVNNASYSIIEQPMINVVLDEHAQELRRLLEEGSGITKYKARRKEAQRKLERTEQDLLRLNDIIEENDREVRSLRYQVGKARRHQRLYDQIRALELLIAGRQNQLFDQEEVENQVKLAELGTLAEADSGELAKLRAEIVAVRPALQERQAERHRLEEALQAYEEELQETERRVLLLEHRVQEHDRRLAENRGAITDTRQRQEDIRAQIDSLNGHLARVATELEETRQQLRERSEGLVLLEDRLTGDRSALEQAVQLRLEFIETEAAHQSHLRELQVKQENRRERLDAAGSERQQHQQEMQAAVMALNRDNESLHRLVTRRKELLAEMARLEREEFDLQATAGDLQQDMASCLAQREASSSRLELLQKIMAEYQGYSQGARQLLQDHATDGRVLGSLANQIQVAEADTAAFETLFAELLDAIVVESPHTALDLIGDLRQREIGQASFLCGASAGTVSELAVPAGGTPARDLVHGPATALPYLQRVLAATALFPTEDAAITAAAQHDGPVPLICLSRSGLLVTSDGVVRGGRGRPEEVSLLGRQEKLGKITAEITGLDTQLTHWRQRLADNRSRQEQLRQEMVRQRGELAVLDEDLKQLHVEIGRQNTRRDAAEQRLAELDRLQANLEADLADLDQAMVALLADLEVSGRQRTDSTTRLDTQRQVVADAEQERDSRRVEVEELRLVVQRLEGRQREIEATIAHLQENLADLSAQQARLGQEIELSQTERETLAAELADRKGRLDEGFSERERRRQVVQAASGAIQKLHDETAVRHERIKEIEEKRTECREQIHRIETQLATLAVRRRNLHERIEEHYKDSFADLLASVNTEHLPRQLERDGEVFQLEQAQELLADRRDKFGQLGPVNQLALQEYESKKERLDFLQGQREDVVKAKEDLTTAITRINRTARKLFSDTFEEVRRYFIAVFQTLFEGGRADLQLIRTDDPLESNIHILAQPRGKVVNHVSLLSGGERCLTALSLLFAVYLVKPSPFCMLDEVDAPLDDSNIQRFVKMLREFSKKTQFMVVTHNKLTMETANHLYGVTMMEQGVSSIVSVTFDDVAETQSDVELGEAIAQRRQELDRRETVKAILADDEEVATGMRFTLDGGEEKDGVDRGSTLELEAEQ